VTPILFAAPGRRMGLDELVPLMLEPGFATLFARVPPFLNSSAHVSPALLEIESPKSRYVRRWRRHARSCEACAAVFRYYGLPIR
jgi:hypothetical protein